MTDTRPQPTVEGLDQAIELLIDASTKVHEAKQIPGVIRTAWRNGIDLTGAEKDIDKLIACIRDYIEYVGEEAE